MERKQKIYKSRLRKVTGLLLSVVIIALLTFIIKRSFFGYSYSGVAGSLGEIKVIQGIDLEQLFGTNTLENRVKYYVSMGYAGRDYVGVLLSFKTDKESFIEIFLHGLPYEKVEDGWFSGRDGSGIWSLKKEKDVNDIGFLKRTKYTNDSGSLKKVKDVNDESSLSFIVDEINFYLPSKDSLHPIDKHNYYYGDRKLETRNRAFRLEAVYNTQDGLSMILIQSSYKGD